MPEQDGPEAESNGADRKRFSKKRQYILLVAALLILTALLFYATIKYDTPDLNELLMRAKLAKLPESIKSLQVDTRPDIEDGRTIPSRRMLFVQFDAEPNDIGDFIASSTSIDKNSFRPLRPVDDRDELPTWFLADQSASGRTYHFKEEDVEGIVAVTDDSGTVSIGAYYVVNSRMRDMKVFVEDFKDDLEDSVNDLIHEVGDLFWD